MTRSTKTLAILLSGPVALTASAEVSYNYEVRPILSDKCFLCHGPDEAHNKADLRLDRAEDAYAALKEGYGHAIVPGKADESASWQRIISSDPDEVMPPPDSNLTLTKKEKETIRQWIEEGAKFEDHWAFVPPAEEVSIPQPQKKEWAKGPIDQFILAKLEENKLSPSQEAPPLRWLRRATFDLTGLPPTLEEIELFLTASQNNSQLAKEKAVDRLLASPAYGEHMAVAWLDAARYADSYGYQSDKLNTQWPYRDWVIEAFNRNIPYDQFLTWNLAGDLLPNPTREQKLATAFNRLHRLNNEGGAIFEEWRTENIADRVHTVGTAFLGLTMECCRCHDHKYDPISMKEYYSLFAFFNSIDENGLYDRSHKVPSPTLLLPTTDQEEALTKAKKQFLDTSEKYNFALQDSTVAFKAWLNNDTPIKEKIGLETPTVGLDFSSGKLDETQAFFAQADHKPAPALSFQPLDGQSATQALALDGDRYISFKKNIPLLDRWTPFTISISLRQSHETSSRAVLAHSSQGTDAGFNAWDLTLENGYLASRMYRVWPGNAMGVRTLKPIPVGELQNITATWDASDQASGLKLFLDGNELPVEITRDNKVKPISSETQHGGKFGLGSRWRDRGLAGAYLKDFAYYDRALTSLEVAKLAELSGVQAPHNFTEQQYKSYFDHAVHPKTKEALLERHKALQNLILAEDLIHEIPYMEELEEPLPAYLLARGEYDAPKNEDTRVQRKIPAAIGPSFPADAPLDRLGLAKWMTDPANPLTARVMVNRLWAGFFGQGLVTTPENFGMQGALPTHPDLLDWLARDFINSGWDIKRFCRKVLLSSTYRQDSSRTAKLNEIDPENFLLARGPAHRLAAEQIRDLALASSGLMSSKRGGPPVSPYQPGEDLWTESNGMSPPYKQSTGVALHRRSLYSVWKRTAPLPNMSAFDVGTREVCTVERSRTNTPLQALVLLNDVQFVEAARALATRVLTEQPNAPLQAAFLSLTGSPPTAKELEILKDLRDDEFEYFKSNPKDAKKLVAHGESPTDDTLPTSQLAATTSACLAILNLDATTWKR